MPYRKAPAGPKRHVPNVFEQPFVNGGGIYSLRPSANPRKCVLLVNPATISHRTTWMPGQARDDVEIVEMTASSRPAHRDSLGLCRDGGVLLAFTPETFEHGCAARESRQ